MTSSLNLPTVGFYYIFPEIPPVIRLTLNTAFPRGWHKIHSPLEKISPSLILNDYKQNSRKSRVVLFWMLFSLMLHINDIKQPCLPSRRPWVLGPVSRGNKNIIYLMKLYLLKRLFKCCFSWVQKLMCESAFVYSSYKRKPKYNGGWDVCEPYYIAWEMHSIFVFLPLDSTLPGPSSGFKPTIGWNCKALGWSGQKIIRTLFYPPTPQPSLVSVGSDCLYFLIAVCSYHQVFAVELTV